MVATTNSLKLYHEIRLIDYIEIEIETIGRAQKVLE
jgi:hypothetical protein